MNTLNDGVGDIGEGQRTVAEPPDFESLLRGSMEELMARTQEHQAGWGFGSEEEWLLDQDQGQLTFKFPGRSSRAPIQIIGTYNTENGTWLWAWANPLIAGHLKADALALKEYGEQLGIPRLTTPEWLAQESDCWYMAALACQLFGRQGAYRGPAEDNQTLMVFGQVTHEPALDDREAILKTFAQQTAAEFRACIENTADQRGACCRYFRRGQALGLPQAELIDSLGLAMPSVLDTAGYSPEESERVMDLIGDISDQEIQDSCIASVA
jgi:hypothetical protein